MIVMEIRFTRLIDIEYRGCILENDNIESLSEFRRMKFHCVVFKPSDALETFAPEGCDDEEFLDEYSEKYGECRWYPEEGGGHRVLFPYLGEDYDKSRFKLVKGAWNHDHCDACGETIGTSDKCWVAGKETYTLLCENCYNKLQYE